MPEDHENLLNEVLQILEIDRRSKLSPNIQTVNRIQISVRAKN